MTPQPDGADVNRYVFRLYVTGHTPRAERAIANLRRLCADVLRNGCDVEVVDVLEQPELAEAERILATPTLIKDFPPPTRRIIGDLSDAERVRRELGIFTPPRERQAGG